MDRWNIEGRTAVVTGGGSGIGAACVASLLGAGAKAVSWDRTDAADVRVDVSSPEDVGRALAQTEDRFGTPTLLVAAAGISHSSTILNESPEDWERVFAVNVRGVFLCLQAVARATTTHGSEGAAVLISSTAGTQADPLLATYSCSKAAVNHLARVAASELGARGFRVNAVAPGATSSPMLANSLILPGYREEIISTTPLGRVGAPEDVAEVVLALLSTGWVTGQVLSADGGSSLLSARGLARVVAREAPT